MDVSELRDARIVITGGLGLIGSTLARTLAPVTADILLIDSLNENFGGNLFNIRDIRGRVGVNISDIRDKHGLRYLLRDRDIIFNLAGQTSHMDSMNAPFEDLEINCTAQLSLLEVCRDVSPKVRIVYASTRQIYGRPQFLPVTEAHPLCPVDVNGINKIAGENYHRLYHDVYGLGTTVLRLTNTYGPGMRVKDARQVFLGVWVRRLIEGEPFEVWGGEQKRDFTYVQDAANAFIAAALSPATIGRILNVGGCEVVSLREVADMAIAANNSGRYVIKEFPKDRKLIDIGDYFTADDEFRRLTGWSAVTDLRTGLANTVGYYRETIANYL